MTVLLAGKQVGDAAQTAAKVAGVKKVLVAEAPYYEGSAAENLAALVLTVAQQYTHILAPASAHYSVGVDTHLMRGEDLPDQCFVLAGSIQVRRIG